MRERVSFARYDRNSQVDCNCATLFDRRNPKTKTSTHRRSQTAATEFGKIRRQCAGPFAFARDSQFRRVQRMSRQEEFLLKLIGPAMLDELQIQLLVGTIN